MNKVNEWKNYGDINYLAYGGCLVRQHYTEQELEKFSIDKENFKYTYDVFFYNPESGDSGSEKFAALCCIDLTDTWLDYPGLLSVIGEDDKLNLAFKNLIKVISAERLAVEFVQYEGIQNFCPTVTKNGQINLYPSDFSDFIVSESDLKSWLKNIGAEGFIQ